MKRQRKAPIPTSGKLLGTPSINRILSVIIILTSLQCASRSREGRPLQSKTYSKCKGVVTFMFVSSFLRGCACRSVTANLFGTDAGELGFVLGHQAPPRMVKKPKLYAARVR